MKRRRGGDESVSSETTPARMDAAGASIAGVVRGAGRALVSLTSDVGSRDVAQETDADGSFRFGHLALGEYVVHVGGEAKKTVHVREEREYYVEL